MSKLRRVSDCTILEVSDPEIGNRFFRPRQAATKKNAGIMKDIEERTRSVSVTRSQSGLLCREQEIMDLIRQFASTCTPNVVIDISCIPKRFFFPFLTVLSETPRVRNLVVCYTCPERYGDILGEDPEVWAPLPMYGGDPLQPKRDATLIIGVGYQPLRLHEFLDGVRFPPGNVKLLLPFPSLPPGFVDNWKFIVQTKRELPQLSNEAIVRVSTYNVSLAFDHLVNLTDQGNSPIVILAPFGPKTISLAMCLYGIARRAKSRVVEIGYTQPTIYGDAYSIGIAYQNKRPVIHAYCIRLDDNQCYAF
jgi:hypothetical protein